MAGLTVVGLLALTGGFLFLMRELRRGNLIQQEVGVEIATPVIRAEGEPIEVITAARVQPGGIAARAGLREGEVIVHPDGKRSLTSMFRWLDHHRGYPITLTVMPGGDGPSLAVRPHRTVTFTLPPR